MMSAYIAPQALSAPAVLGSMTRVHPSSRAIGTILSPEAPPPATMVTSRGSIPCAIVISRIAPTIFSVAMTSTAEAASSTDQPSGAAMCSANARRAASTSSESRPPRK